MEFIYLILFVYFTGFLNASIALTLDSWMQPTMILSKYRCYLASLLLRNDLEAKKLKKDKNPFMCNHLEQLAEERKSGAFKILGGCVYCFSVYLTFFVYPVMISIWLSYFPFTYWLLPAWLGIVFVSSYFIRNDMNKI